MSPTDVPDADRLTPDAWGIHRYWIDANNESAVVSDETVEALRDLIGDPPDDLDDTAPIVTRPGSDLALGRLHVTLESGDATVVDGVLPDNFPLGYHRAHTGHGVDRALIVSPGRCWLPDDWRAWGWTVQLYAARSRSSWEIGDLADLKSIRAWSEGLGAGFLLVNPLHAVAPTLPQETSPYLPATRRFRNPTYLRVENVPGAEQVDLSTWREAVRLDDATDTIARDLVWPAKRDALAAIHAAVGTNAEFAGWRDEQGPSLQCFAVWSALAEDHGPDWHAWSAGLQDPGSDDVVTYAAEHAPRVEFFAWLQWLVERQLIEASGDLKVLQDLPIGVDGGGADAWEWQQTVAGGATVGAPPDLYNKAGQDWGSPPLVPWRLRAADYAPFISSIRATMSGGGGIRIDHVMGLFRLWWVPAGRSPAAGAYVRYPSADLLDIVALESHRAQSLVVGEDLGTVEDGVREDLADHAILSYRLLYFEDDEPAQWPVSAMAAVTTHDLPTVAGLWTGSDVDEQETLVDVPRGRLDADRQALLDAWVPGSEVTETATAAEAVAAAHRRLAEAPCILLSATLEDAVAEERRPNVPAVTSRSNWSLPLAVPVDDLPRHPGARQVASILAAAISGAGSADDRRPTTPEAPA